MVIGCGRELQLCDASRHRKSNLSRHQVNCSSPALPELTRYDFDSSGSSSSQLSGSAADASTCTAARLVDGSQSPRSPETKLLAHEDRSGLGPCPLHSAIPTRASPATCGLAGSAANAGRAHRGSSDRLDVNPSTNGDRSCDKDNAAVAIGLAILHAEPAFVVSGSGPSLHSSSRSDAPKNAAARSALWVGSSPHH